MRRKELRELRSQRMADRRAPNAARRNLASRKVCDNSAYSEETRPVVPRALGPIALLIERFAWIIHHGDIELSSQGRPAPEHHPACLWRNAPRRPEWRDLRVRRSPV